MAWFYLIIAGLFEVVWAVGLKYCDGLKINIGMLTVVVGTVLSILFLSLAMRSISVGTSYAVWAGVGIIGVSLYGILFLGESTDVIRILFLLMILLGIIGLKLITNE